jgi:signal transduction histidine kinase/integral membrane sensor domain MASE1
MNHFWRYFTVVGLLSVAYFLMAQLAISILDLKASASPFWPPAGIALAALILQGQRIWPGVALGSFLFARFHEVSLLSACGLAFGSALQAVVGAELLHRMRFHPSLKRLQDVLQLLVFGAWVSPLVNATISTFVGCLSNTVAPPNWQENWRILWLGDWMGILVATPLLLVLSHWIVDFRVLILGRRILRKDKKLLKLRRFGVIPNFLFPTPLSKGEAGGEIPCLAEAFVCFALLFTISWFVFGATTGIGIARYPLEYLPFPFVVWAALRFAQRGAVVATLIVSVTAIWGVAQKVGPFVAKAGDFYQAILFLHGFMSIVIIMALVLAATGSERTFAVDLLKEREASLANAQRLAQLGNWDFYETCQGRKEPHQQLRWSDELYRLFGFTPKAFKPSWEAFFQVVHSADRDRVGEAIRGALRENKPYSLEYRILLPDGSQRVVCEQSEIHSGGISGTVQDVTERKHVEVQLRAVAERERLLGEMALRIRRSLNLDQILNTTVAEVRQFLKADRVFIGQIDAFKTNCDRSLQGLVIAESVDPSYPSLRSLILDDETSLREWRSLLEQSRIRVTEDTGAIAVPSQIAAYYSQYQIKALLAVPILLGDELYGALVVNQCEQSRHWQSWEIDWLTSLATQVAIAIQQAELYRQITDLNSHLESQVEERTQELSAKMAELQELNQLKDVFLQAVSHDLRTSLLGMSMVLNNLYQSSETTVTLSRPLIERMMVSNERQLNLIDSLLEDHFDEERQLELHSKPVQLEKLIQDLISDYSTKLALNKANLTVRLPEDCPLITADPKHLRRVLENLLTNALKHNPPGLNLNLQISVEDDMIRCTLQDDGVGISLEQQKSLFKLYIRGLHTQHLTGIGLGLYQCRQIIDAHGGEIGVISGPKAGSTFWFTLPVLKIGSGEW